MLRTFGQLIKTFFFSLYLLHYYFLSVNGSKMTYLKETFRGINEVIYPKVLQSPTYMLVIISITWLHAWHLGFLVIVERFTE